MTACQIPLLDPQKLALPAVLVAGLVDGINPCAIGMLVFLLGYLLVFAGKPERVLRTGLLYITTVYLTYFLLGFFFYQSLSRFLSSPVFAAAAYWLQVFLGGGLIIAGLVNIKDFFFFGRGLSLEIPQRLRPRLQKLVEKTTYPATVLLAVLVTLFEAPCSFPLYAGTLGILSRCDLSSLGILGYLGLYNLLFILPLLVILFLLYSGVEIVYLKEWEHQNKRTMRGIMGVILVILGGLVLILR